MRISRITRRVWLLAIGALSCATSFAASAPDPKFTIAVVPDTQNYLDFNLQRASGYPFDAVEIFYDQMQWVARNVESAGGEIAFVTQVGDVWQHYTNEIDAAHRALGMEPDYAVIPLQSDARTRTIEMPAAQRGFEMIHGKVPFSVVPGNHDYDSVWVIKGVAPTQQHLGGFTNFNSVFGERSPFFRNKPWRVASFNGGADSATVFTAGGYRFLHIGLDYEPTDDVLAWAESVMRKYPGLPTIIATHNFLNNKGERKGTSNMVLKAGHPEHNSPEDIWQKLLSRHSQIFLLVCGHQTSQARRVDAGAEGGKVWQLLSDYQDRQQVYLNTAGPNARQRSGLGDGWLRLLEFDFTAAVPRMRVRTYSTYFKAFASDLPTYVAWYKSREKPGLTDEAFLAEDEFTIELDDFVKRFGAPKGR